MALSDTQILDLRAERAKKVKEANDLLELSRTEKRDMTAEETQKFDKLHQAADADLVVITREEKQATANRSVEQRGGGASATDIAKRDGGNSPMTDAEKKEDLEKREEALESFLRTGRVEHRAMTTSSDLSGGLLVPPDTSMYGKIVTAMKAFGFPEDDCEVLNTATGAPLPIPTSNDTFNVAQAIAESQGLPSDAPDVQVGQVILGAYKYGTGVLKVSTELMQDAAINIDDYVGTQLGIRMGRVKNFLLTQGTGAAQPTGIMTGSKQTITAAGETSIAYTEFLNLIHSVDPAYRPSAQLMFHDTTLLALKKLTDNYGRPLFLAGISLKEPDTLNGYSYVINQNMPAMAAGANTMLFGNLKNYYVRNVTGFAVQRLAELFAPQGLVGFVGFMRFDGNIVDAGTHPLAYLQQAA